MTGVYLGKAIGFTNEPSMWHSFVKTSFVDDGDMQLVMNRFDRNTYCIVSGGNFVYSLSYLRTWRIQSYSALMFILQEVYLLTPKSKQVSK